MAPFGLGGNVLKGRLNETVYHDSLMLEFFFKMTYIPIGTTDEVRGEKLDCSLRLLEDPPERPFIQLGKEAAIDSAVSVIFDKWNLKSPDILVSFIGGIRFFKSWKKEDHRAALQKGIVKLVNTADCWIVTNGLNYGVAKLIGDAVRNEQRHRESKQKHEVFIKGYMNTKKTNIVLMGMVPGPLLADPEALQGVQGGIVKVRMHKDKLPKLKYDMDPFHTHFVILKRSYKSSGTFRVQLQKEFAREAGIRKKPTAIVQEYESDSEGEASPDVEGPRSTIVHEHVPVVAVLVQGGPGELDQVHSNLKNGVPVIIIYGTGFLADILAVTLEDFQYEHGGNPAELNLLRTDVGNRVNRAFPSHIIEHDSERMTVRDKILDCIAMGSAPDGRTLLTVISSNEDLSNLDDHVLTAVFEARSPVSYGKRSQNIREQIRSDLVLTMKFNKPLLAESKVMARDEWHLLKIDNDLYEKSLLWKRREAFLERFMEQDFNIHRYISHSTLLLLFRRAEDAEFFTTVVWEQLLARIVDDVMRESFVTKDLNLIVEELSGIRNFLSMAELSRNCMGKYESEAVAERKNACELLFATTGLVLLERSHSRKTPRFKCPSVKAVLQELSLWLAPLYRTRTAHKQEYFHPHYSNDSVAEEGSRDVHVSLSAMRAPPVTQWIRLSIFHILTGLTGTPAIQGTNALLIWAVLMNRFEIARSLWRFCDDPIPLALFLSAMYRNLRQYCPESETASKLRDYSRAFSKMATDVLDMSYRESNARAFDLLNQKFVDFNDKTPLKLAYDCENRYFLAHESCQKWLTHIWEGGIEIAGSLESRIIGIPDSLKLILSALFIFPIRFWIQYPRKNFEKQFRLDGSAEFIHRGAAEDEDVFEDIRDPYHVNLEDPEEAEKRIKSLATMEADELAGKSAGPAKRRKSTSKSQSNNSLYRRELPFYKKILYLWTAPRTKFWMFQLSYWIYLALFSITVILPTCDSMHLDIVIITWTFLMVIEMILRTIYQVKKDYPVELFDRFAEILILAIFVIAAFFLRIVGIYFGLVRPFYSRALMSVGLLYMYYRMIAVFFPMHPTLGPMLYRIKRMLAVDFVNFLKLVFPFLLANMFVLQAVMYPDFPFGSETWRRGFFRAFFTLFTAFLGEIDYTDRCEHDRIVNSSDYCWAGDYTHHECPTIGWTSYLLNIQYMVILKLILVTLLYALFSGTLMKVKEEAEYIWKFQRYGIVLDFASRPALPPPFSVFYYMFYGIISCCGKMKGINHARMTRFTKSKAFRMGERRLPKAAGSYNYWMGLTKEYYRKNAQDEKDKRISKDQFKITEQIVEEQGVMKGNMVRLRDRMKELEKKADENRLHLEEIKHLLELSATNYDDESGMHRLSRQSPYPGTDIQRFYVFNKYISWDVVYELYDPSDYSKPVEKFPPADRPFVDPKMASKIGSDDESETNILDRDGEVVLPMSPHLSNMFCWNDIATEDGITRDRRSWILERGRPVHYALNELGLPRNPKGRTGVTGRGSLTRFGPNHCVQLLITRGTSANLQIVSMKALDHTVSSHLPKQFIRDGDNKIFSVACSLFAGIFVKDDSQEPTSHRNVQSAPQASKVMEQVGFPKHPYHSFGSQILEVAEISRGYWDDARNTDNAWVEVASIRLHLKSYREFDRRFREEYGWEDATRLRKSTLGPQEIQLLEWLDSPATTKS